MEQETTQPEPVQAPVAEVAEVDLLKQLDVAMKSGDFKAVAKVANEVAKLQKTQEQAELAKKQAVLTGTTESIKSIIQAVLSPIANAKPISEQAIIAITEKVNTLAKAKALDLADGIWYTNDFGEKLVTCRLVKSTPRKASSGGGGKKFTISSTDLFAKYGEQEYKDGISFNQAFEGNTDGNFRYQLRQKLLKLDGQLS